MIPLFQLASDLQSLFERNRWRFSFIGGIALQRWGEPRLTVDVDVALLTGFGTEEPFIDELMKHYEGRREDTKEFALERRVLLLRSSGDIGIDIVLAALPFEENVVDHSTHYEFMPGLKLLTCSAEDLIVMKTFADRGQDWVDVEGVIVRQQGNLDWAYIFEELSPLCELKEAPEIIKKLVSIRSKLT